MAVIELNRTHATNPFWHGHARFHLVWQNLTAILVAGALITLLWMRDERFYLVAGFTLLPLIAFLLANVARPLYNGSMSDPNGVPPIRIGDRSVDGNTIAVILGLIATVTAIVLYNR